MTHAVIFDIDGTLLDSSDKDEDLYKQAVRRILGQVSFRPGLGDYDHVTDSGILLQVLDDNGVAPDDTIVSRIKQAFFDLVGAQVAAEGPFREIPGARSVVERIRASSTHAAGIATGGWRESAMIKLSTAGFAIEGIPLATSDDAIDRAAIMRTALAAIGPDFESVTYFGDGPWDQQACQELGWTFRPVGPLLNGLSSFHNAFPELMD